MVPVTADPVEALLAKGVRNTWYPICPSTFVTDKPVSLRRVGYRMVLWRDFEGQAYALEDRCPHRGAPLSQGIVMGDRIACGYRSEEHTSELQSRQYLVCRLLL